MNPSSEAGPPTANVAAVGSQNPVASSGWMARKHRVNGIIKGLAICEIALGAICIMVGAIALAYQKTHVYYLRYYIYFGFPSTGAGIWCGAWIIIAGGLGLGAARKEINQCMVQAHLALSIIASLFAATLCGLSIAGALYSYFPFNSGLVISNAVISFVAFTLLIVSASYSCCLSPTCEGCYDPELFEDRPSHQARYSVPVSQPVGPTVHPHIIPGHQVMHPHGYTNYPVFYTNLPHPQPPQPLPPPRETDSVSANQRPPQ